MLVCCLRSPPLPALLLSSVFLLDCDGTVLYSSRHAQRRKKGMEISPKSKTEMTGCTTKKDPEHTNGTQERDTHRQERDTSVKVDRWIVYVGSGDELEAQSERSRVILARKKQCPHQIGWVATMVEHGNAECEKQQ